MGFEGNWAFAVSAAVDALVVCGLVVWAVRSRPGWLRLALACGLVLALLALKGIVLVANGLGIPFGVMHVLWLDLVVVLPLAAASLGVLGWRTGGTALRGLVVLGLLLAPVGAYASFVEPERLVVERATVELATQRAGDADVRIAVIADLQFERLGDHEREAVERVMAERPDLILLSGDYHQGMADSFEQELPDLRRLLGRLRAPGGVFAVQGDSESVAKARRVFSGTGIRLLVDEQASTRVRDRAISIGGLRLRYWQASAGALRGPPWQAGHQAAAGPSSGRREMAGARHARRPRRRRSYPWRSAAAAAGRSADDRVRRAARGRGGRAALARRAPDLRESWHRRGARPSAAATSRRSPRGHDPHAALTARACRPLRPPPRPLRAGARSGRGLRTRNLGR